MTSESPAARLRSDRVPLGIAYMMGATALFSASQAASKWQVDTYSFAEVLFFRGFGSLVICALLILPRHGLAVFRTRRLGAHVARNATQTVAQSFILIALAMMPLAGAMAINFSSPLFASLAAALFLGERIGIARGMALVTGFCGVLVVIAPGADTFTTGALFALGNAVLYGSITAAVRGLSVTESAETLTMHQMVMLSVFFAALLPVYGFRWPANAFDWTVLMTNGVLNGVGQYWWTRALSMAPPAAVGPFYYFTLVWAMLFGFVFWGDVPTPALLAGSAIVVGSGLFLWWRDRGSKSKELPAD